MRSIACLQKYNYAATKNQYFDALVLFLIGGDKKDFCGRQLLKLVVYTWKIRFFAHIFNAIMSCQKIRGKKVI